MTPSTILVADDERHIRHLIRYKLERAGYRVLVATNGRQAHELAMEHRPDLVVTDFQMPLMSGLELAMRLMECPETSRTPVLLVTGRGYRVAPSDLARTRIRHLLPKPFSPRELLAHVEDTLRTHREADNAGEVEAA